jgi:hypothetical protein
MRIDSGKVEKQACCLIKTMDKRKAGALSTKQREGVKFRGSKHSGILRGSAATRENKWQQKR